MNSQSHYPVHLFVKIFFNYFCGAIIGIGAIISLLLALWATFAITFGADPALNEGMSRPIIIFSLWLIAIMMLSLTVFLANLFPSVRVSENGLHVQVFLFWRTFVPWGDIETLQPTWLGRVFNHSVYVIVLKRFTLARWFWIRPFSLKPGFEITKQTKQMDELLKTIKGKINH